MTGFFAPCTGHAVGGVPRPGPAGHKGGRIGALPAPESRALFSVAGVSGASWLVALALGAFTIPKAAPSPTPDTRGARARLADIAGDTGARG